MLTHFVEYDPRRVIRLDNQNCVYCGQIFNESQEPTKEHVIGRRFVPKGTLHGNFNLIANACSVCNQTKAALETVISAVTMQPDVLGNYVSPDEVLVKEAERKGSNPKSRVRIPDKIDVKAKFAGADFGFGFVSPPQICSEQVAQLAYYHVIGFFFLQTYSDQTRRGGFPIGSFYILTDADYLDWGNDLMIWFMDETKRWQPSLHCNTANEYFKVCFRKAENGTIAWALEWNKKRRCVGFWGDSNLIQMLAEKQPTMKKSEIAPNLFMREEQVLEKERDVLFVLY